MEENQKAMDLPSELQERKKRKRELGAIILLSVLFLFLTWIEFRLLDISKTLPFVHSIFFFGLVNFNIILFLFILFLIFRNFVKVLTEKKKGVFGSTLKSKLIVSFIAFSSIPTVLMFIVSVFYINNTFDKWFSEKMMGVLKSSFEITDAYHQRAKKQNYHFARQVTKNLIVKGTASQPMMKQLQSLRDQYSLDSLEFYPNLFDEKIHVKSKNNITLHVPDVSLEFLQKAIKDKAEASMIHHYSDGNLIRVIVPFKMSKGDFSAVVVSSFVPMSLLSRMDDITTAYEDFKNISPLENRLKTIYHIMLILMTLTILLLATWFGFHLAKELSIPLEKLGEATRDVAKGVFRKLKVKSASKEIEELVSNFNFMTTNLEKSEREIQDANKTLKLALRRLDEHSKYMKVVLSNISAGVVSINKEGVITTINKRAEKLLSIEAKKFIGKKADEALNDEHYAMFLSLSKTLKKHQINFIQKELKFNVKNKTIPLQVTISIMKDDRSEPFGQILVFNDLSPVVSAQRAAAWREVARRIAHEIKNPLTPIRLSAQRLEKKFADQIQDEAFHDCTRMIIDQVDNLKVLVNEFSNFARLPSARPVKSNLNKTILQAMAPYKTSELLKKTTEENIAIHYNEDENLPEFLFDPEQMKRVMVNLIENSLAAIRHKEDGEIEIKTEFDSLLKIVRISVVDNGQGIAKRLLDRIFEPYMTTKDHGTGLGLAIVKRTIEDHNGFIRAFNNVPNGTKIIIELPVLETTTSAGQILDHS